MREDREGKPPRDGDARWDAKGTRRFQNTQGKKIKQTQYFFGYKAHYSLNAESELITSVVVTPGISNDGQLLPELLDMDMAQGIPLEVVADDRSYDDGDNHFLLKTMSLHSAIRLNDYRTHKKDANKQIWLDLQAAT